MELMIDLETFGRSPMAVFTQIGWAVFHCEHGGTIIESGCIYVDIDSCLKAGLRIDGPTLRWWLGQGEEAREEMRRPGISLTGALAALGMVYSQFLPKRIWCRGLDFDLAILRSAYFLTGQGEPPWEYNAGRDVRTLHEIFPVDYPAKDSAKQHTAEYDARRQAWHVIDMLKKKEEKTS